MPTMPAGWGLVVSVNDEGEMSYDEASPATIKSSADWLAELPMPIMVLTADKVRRITGILDGSEIQSTEGDT